MVCRWSKISFSRMTSRNTSTPTRRSLALRVLGQETDLIPKQRLVAALRNMLDRPQLADLVIPDLARWQDWGAAGPPGGAVQERE